MNVRTTPLWLRVYIVVLVIFMLAPVVIVVVSSFGAKSYLEFPPSSFSLRWYGKAFGTSGFMHAALVSAILGALATAVSTVLGLPAALAISKGGRLRRQIEGFLLAPLSFPTIILGVTLLFLYGRIGLGLSPAGLLAGHAAIVLPYMVRSVVAVKRSVNPDLEAAAATLGCGPLKRFWFIVLPLIRPGLLAGAIFAFLVSFDNVPISLFLTRPDTTTLPVAILGYLQFNSDPAVAAISAVQALIVILVLSIVERRLGLRFFERMESRR